MDKHKIKERLTHKGEPLYFTNGCSRIVLYQIFSKEIPHRLPLAVFHVHGDDSDRDVYSNHGDDSDRDIYPDHAGDWDRAVRVVPKVHLRDDDVHPSNHDGVSYVFEILSPICYVALG